MTNIIFITVISINAILSSIKRTTLSSKKKMFDGIANPIPQTLLYRTEKEEKVPSVQLLI